MIAYLSPRYSRTIVARTNMARTPKISEADAEALAAKVSTLGYDVPRLQRVPLSW